MAGMDQKDRCSCIYKSGIDGYNASRAVFPSLVGRPMLGILTGMDLKDSWCGMYNAGIAGDSAHRAVFLPFRQAHDAPHHGRHAPAGQLSEAIRKLDYLR